MKITEAHIQAALMAWVFGQKQHKFVMPNSRDFFGWEADLISITKSNLTHEYEVKLSIQDYKVDAKKYKHYSIGTDFRSPAYFWYVTYEFDIDPPEKAGWILISKTDTDDGSDLGYRIDVKKKAPKLNSWKPSNAKIEQIARILSWRIYNVYKKQYLTKSWNE